MIYKRLSGLFFLGGHMEFPIISDDLYDLESELLYNWIMGKTIKPYQLIYDFFIGV